MSGPDPSSVAPTVPKIVAPEISLNDSQNNHGHNHKHIPAASPIPNVKLPPIPVSSSPGSSLGAGLVPHRDKRAARESRITLPDEAARYIANMQDSPLAEEFEDASEGNESGAIAYPSQDESDDEDEDEDEDDTDSGVSPVDAEVAYPITETDQNNNKSPTTTKKIHHAHHGSQASNASHTPQATPIKELMKERKTSGDSRDDSSRNYSIDSSGATSTSKDVDEETQSSTPMPHHVQHMNVPHLANSQAYQTPPPQALGQANMNANASSPRTGPNGEPLKPQLYTQTTGTGSQYSWTSGAGVRPNFNHQRSNNSVSSLSASQTSSPADFIPAAAYPGYAPKDPRMDPREGEQTIPGAGGAYGQPQSFYDINAQPQYSQPKAYKAPQSHVPHVRPQLTPGDLATARIRVGASTIKSNDRGKEVLSFVIDVKVSC
jgi:RalA-binding protein 1